MMSILKTPGEIQIMRESAQILGKVHGDITRALQVGVAKAYLNGIAVKSIEKYGAKPSFKGLLDGFPGVICASVNDEVVHGTPSHYELKAGDIVTIDCGVCYKGYHSDSAFTHIVGRVNKELLHLLAVTEEAMNKGIAAFRVGNTLGDIGHAIQKHVESNGFSIVKEYTGHSIGRELHQKPYVHNHGKPGEGMAIQEGMVFAIEPIANMGSAEVYEVGKWGVRTKDKKPACHFEHTVAIVNGLPEILTTFDHIKAEKR